MDKEYYSINEFADKLGVSWRTIYRAIKNGRISALRVGSTKNSTYRIHHGELYRMGVVELKTVFESLIKQE